MCHIGIIIHIQFLELLRASHFLTISQQEGQRLKLTDAEYAFMVRYGPQTQYKIQILG